MGIEVFGAHFYLSRLFHAEYADNTIPPFLAEAKQADIVGTKQLIII